MGALLVAALSPSAPWSYEEGETLPELKTIEGRPEGGLRYRLRMGNGATVETPDRLIVWLHPGGGSWNKQVEALSPRLVQHRFALLVTTEKDFSSWSGEDAVRLLKSTLPEVASLPGIDARRPILMGFSGGGQLALDLWYGGPARFGGLILDAAYPVEERAGRQALRELPQDPGVRRTPVFVLIGEEDEVGEVWKRVEPRWRAAGVPLSIHRVPARGHEWLFDEARTQSLLAWLDGISDLDREERVEK